MHFSAKQSDETNDLETSGVGSMIGRKQLPSGQKASSPAMSSGSLRRLHLGFRTSRVWVRAPTAPAPRSSPMCRWARWAPCRCSRKRGRSPTAPSPRPMTSSAGSASRTVQGAGAEDLPVRRHRPAHRPRAATSAPSRWAISARPARSPAASSPARPWPRPGATSPTPTTAGSRASTMSA